MGFCAGEAFSKRSRGILLRREEPLAVLLETSEPGAPPQGCSDPLGAYPASERTVCRVVGQHRSSQRQNGKVDGLGEGKLRRRLHDIAAEQIRGGLRMA